MALAHVTLATRELARSTGFFHEVMGWTPIGRPRNNAAPGAWLKVAPGQELHLIEVPGFEPSLFEQEYGRHVAVSFPRAEFKALKERLIAHGATIVEPLRETPFDRFFFRDPNGYIFEVVDQDRCNEILAN